jgi:hypothetical protein
MRMNEETKLQDAIQRALCWLPGVVAWRCNTGKRGGVRFGLRDLQNSVAGTPDIIGIASGRFLAVEVKLPGQLCSPAQDARLEQIRKLGGIALVGCDVRAVVEQVKHRQRQLADQRQLLHLLGLCTDDGAVREQMLQRMATAVTETLREWGNEGVILDSLRSALKKEGG